MTWLLLCSGDAFQLADARGRLDRDAVAASCARLTLPALAHALARINRYAGHALRPCYSVAQHSCALADWLLEHTHAPVAPGNRAHVGARAPVAPGDRAHVGAHAPVAPGEQAARWALLHDAHEIVTGDIPRPTKLIIGDALLDLKYAFDEGITARFGVVLDKAEIVAVRAADARILHDERRQVLAAPTGFAFGRPWGDARHAAPLGVKLEPWDAIRAEHEWLWRARALGLRP